MKTILIFLAASLGTAFAGQKSTVPVPPSLAPFGAEVRGFMGAIGKIGLTLRSKEPLTEEQWAAIASVPVTSYNFMGNFVNKDGLAHLAKMPVEVLILTGCIAKDDAAASFTAMTSLKRLGFSHCTLSAKVAEALAQHPALESITSDHRLIGDNIAFIATAPKLTHVHLMHGAGSDRAAKALENHPRLEIVEFVSTGAPVLTEAGVASLLTLKNVKELALHNTVATCEGSLKQLKTIPALTKLTMMDVDISEADIAKVKADLPKVEIKFEPMGTAGRQHWDKSLEYRLRQEANAAKKAAK